MKVPPKRTVVSLRDYARAVLRAWRVVDEGTPEKRAVGVLWAQYMIETGGRACWNWNIGNVKHVEGDGHDYHELRGVWEGVPLHVARDLIARGLAKLDDDEGHKKMVAPRVAVVFEPPHPATRFRAYLNLGQAMASHLAFLKRRFILAWDEVVNGSPREFAKKLKAGRDGIEGTNDDYFTASSKAYADGMMRHFAVFLAADAYDLELRSLLDTNVTPTVPADEEDTPTMPVEVPDMRPAPLKHVDFQIVHPRVPLGRPALDGDLPKSDDEDD